MQESDSAVNAEPLFCWQLANSNDQAGTAALL